MGPRGPARPGRIGRGGRARAEREGVAVLGTRVEIDAEVDRGTAVEVGRLAHLAGFDEVRTGVVAEDGPPGSGVVRVARGAAPGAVRLPGHAADFVLPRDGVALGVALRERHPADRARVVGVLGARGGLGASTLAAVVACTAREAGWDTALVDLDPLPGACAEALDLDDAAGLRWADLTLRAAPLVGARLAAGLPRWREVRVLCGDERGGPAPGVADAALSALRGAVDVLVVDLPRSAWAGSGAADACEDLVILAGAEEASLGLLRAPGAADAPPGQRRWLAVRRGARHRFPPDQVAYAAGLPLLGVVGDERGLADAIALGDGPWLGPRGPLRRVAARTVAALGLREDRDEAWAPAGASVA